MSRLHCACFLFCFGFLVLFGVGWGTKQQGKEHERQIKTKRDMAGEKRRDQINCWRQTSTRSFKLMVDLLIYLFLCFDCTHGNMGKRS